MKSEKGRGRKAYDLFIFISEVCMAEIIFRIADLSIKLETEQVISVSERFKPFLNLQETKGIDCVLELKRVEQFSEKRSDGCWNGFRYYVDYGEEQKIFHFEADEKEPYAVTNIKGNGTIQLQYLAEVESYLSDMEGIFRHIGFETFLSLYQRMMLHASFVRYQQHAILFSAPSGMGKSTQAQLWETVKDAEIINGDRVALGKTKQGWMAWGIPYAGSSMIYKNESGPIGAIVILKQAKENRIEKISGSMVFGHLYPELSIHHWDERFVERAMTFLMEIIREIPVFLLECLPDESAVHLLYQTLKQEGILK